MKLFQDKSNVISILQAQLVERQELCWLILELQKVNL